MTRIVVLTAAASLAAAVALGQEAQKQEPAKEPTAAASELAGELARRVGENLHVKAVVGRSLTAGSVTLIPILMIDVNFGGAGLLSPGAPSSAVPKANAPQTQPAGADGFLMSGEARPLGFVVVTRQGTRFIAVPRPSAK